MLVVLAVAVAGCERDREISTSVVRHNYEIDIAAPVVEGHGGFNVPWSLRASPGGPVSGPDVIGPFEILEVRYDASWTCEWPARWCRVRMLEGEPLEGWASLKGW
jgi:hypothetical protein